VNPSCSNCGSSVEPDDMFCWSCGASISLPRNNPPVAPPVANFGRGSVNMVSVQNQELRETRKSERPTQSQAPIACGLGLAFAIVISGVALFVLAPTVFQGVFRGLSNGLGGAFRAVTDSLFVSPLGILGIVFVLVVLFIPFVICLGAGTRRR